ncbi:MAG: hypothetical protein QXT45_07105 [Candidatus Bilamarchaeaceae archaeon]
MKQFESGHKSNLLNYIHFVSLLSFLSIIVLLVMGQLVTSFRAGMADPVWPTEPWYLYGHFRLDFGYLIEHVHRIAGFVTGVLVLILSLMVLITELRPVVRWVGLLAVVVLLIGYSNFHRGLIAQRGVTPAEVVLPIDAILLSIFGLFVLTLVTVSGIIQRNRHSILRLVSIVILVAIMIQGLLGGFRVMLNELQGTNLATLHGIFAHVIVGLFATLVVLTHPRFTHFCSLHRHLSHPASSHILISVFCVIILYFQIALGAIIRHDPGPIAQRLHFLSAFLVSIAITWLLFEIKRLHDHSLLLGRLPNILTMLLICQIILGIEAWMEKFGAHTIPELVPVTKWNAMIRTLHALVGGGMVAIAVMIAVWLSAPVYTHYCNCDQAEVQK